LLEDADFYRRMADAPNPYGDGRAAERIIAALEHLLLGGPAPRPFGPGFNRHAILAAAGYAREGEPLALTATGERGLADPPLVGHRWHLP
jgi:UDP-N-acetylglucosamine 2-epimerase (non-hydrolysing)